MRSSPSRPLSPSRPKLASAGWTRPRRRGLRWLQHRGGMSMAATGTETVGATPARSSLGRVIFASLIGTTIEWYDFFLYGTAAALVFNKIFFPTLDPILGTMAAFATYGVGFIGRPMGGIVFGHFGDRIGRKSMLLVTLLMMGIPSMVIGLIP